MHHHAFHKKKPNKAVHDINMTANFTSLQNNSNCK